MIYYITLKNITYEVEVLGDEAVLLSESDNGGKPESLEIGLSPKNAVSFVQPTSPLPAAAAPIPAATPVLAPSLSTSSTVPVESGAVLSPMPGSILDLSVVEGQHVAAGDVVLILEAMKMENEIVATTSGVIQKILVTKGQSVQTGAPLVVIG